MNVTHSTDSVVFHISAILKKPMPVAGIVNPSEGTALEAQEQAREGAADTEAQHAALEARLADAQRIIDSLITRVEKPPQNT